MLLDSTSRWYVLTCCILKAVLIYMSVNSNHSKKADIRSKYVAVVLFIVPCKLVVQLLITSVTICFLMKMNFFCFHTEVTLARISGKPTDQPVNSRAKKLAPVVQRADNFIQ